MTVLQPPPVGTIIHGFANGYFGRLSYRCRMVEAVGADWIVTREIEPEHSSRRGLLGLITVENFHKIDHERYAQECEADWGC